MDFIGAAAASPSSASSAPGFSSTTAAPFADTGTEFDLDGSDRLKEEEGMRKSGRSGVPFSLVTNGRSLAPGSLAWRKFYLLCFGASLICHKGTMPANSFGMPAHHEGNWPSTRSGGWSTPPPPLPGQRPDPTARSLIRSPLSSEYPLM